MTFASTANAKNAKNAFNKFPTNQSTTNTQGYQVTTYSVINNRQAKVVTNTRRIKRIVEPVPETVTNRVSFASDMGTLNLRSGFNKMAPQHNTVAKPMPVFVDKRAQTAR